MAGKYITDIKVVGMEKIKKDIAGKRYEFVLEVKWNSTEATTIYRPHSMFFDFQGVLTEMFKNHKIPNLPVAKFNWSFLLGKLGHEKECKSMEEFCLKIIRMPPVVSQAQIVLHFFEMWGTDHRSNPKSSEIFDPAVGRPSIQSSQEQRQPSNAENPEKYKIMSNYEATNIGELSLIEGHLVTIIEKNERGWWFVANESGKQGWAPATYLEPMHNNSDVEETGYDWVSVLDANGKGERYVSLVSYDAQNDDELSYAANEEIEVVEKSSYGWWKVRLGNKTGITPATNMRRVEDSFLYQTTSELKTRTVSISSASGLYAVIRKPPPRKESVRSSRSSSGISNNASPGNSLKNKESGMKRFVYSQASFSGGNFVIGEDDEKEYEERRGEKFLSRSPSEDDILHSREAYENVESSSLKRYGSGPIHSDDINHKNQQFKRENEVYQAVADYSPEDHKKEDIPLKKGDIVQCIASNAGWLFVIKTRSKNNNEQEQGWVPESYLERVYKNGAQRKGRPRPTPRPKPKSIPSSPAHKPNPPFRKGISHQQNNQSDYCNINNDSTTEDNVILRSSRDKLVLPTNDNRRSSSPNFLIHERPNSDYRKSSSPSVLIQEKLIKSANDTWNAQIIDNKRPGTPTDHKKPSTPNSSGSRNDLEKRMPERPPMPPPLMNEIQQIAKYEEDVYDQPEAPLRSVYDSEPWFYGNISRGECERILGSYGHQQQFLMRESVRAPGSYALSVKYCHRIRHFPIEATDDNELAIGKLTFPNLMEIVTYYKEKPLFFSERKEPICLGECLLKENVPG